MEITKSNKDSSKIEITKCSLKSNKNSIHNFIPTSVPNKNSFAIVLNSTQFLYSGLAEQAQM